jgi:hypothetical protein
VLISIFRSHQSDNCLYVIAEIIKYAHSPAFNLSLITNTHILNLTSLFLYLHKRDAVAHHSRVGTYSRAHSLIHHHSPSHTHSTLAAVTKVYLEQFLYEPNLLKLQYALHHSIIVTTRPSLNVITNYVRY